MNKNIHFLKKLFKHELIILLLIILAGGFLRLYNLDWDRGHYLHPDERLYVNASNIHMPSSINELLSPASPLDPHMFYYGTFPLYLYKIINVLILPAISFTLVSRIISSLFSVATIPLIFLITKRFLKDKQAILAAIIFAFSAGSIQYAHFNTTESILLFLLSLATFFSIKYLENQSYKSIIILGVVIGLSYGTKITALLYLIFPAISFLSLLIKRTKIEKIIIQIFIFAFVSLLVGAIFSIYQIVDLRQFTNEQTYMQAIVIGSQKAPFSIIYEGTLPYIFPLINVLPFTFGFISLPLAIIGLYFCIKNFYKDRSKRGILLFILVFPILYFLWSGAWFTKFARYYILLFPFLSIWAAIGLSKLKRFTQLFLVALIMLNGILFIRIYLSENTRIQGSEWIYNNVPEASIIAGEHWDDNLPLPLAPLKNYTTTQLTVYDADSPGKIAQLGNTLSKSDYFVITSRRVFYSILQNPKQYPLTTRFYSNLFEGNLGFSLVKKFTNYPFIVSDDFADESFQSYDHPPVYIYKNVGRFSKEQIVHIITSNK